MKHLIVIPRGIFFILWICIICAIIPFTIIYALNLTFPELFVVELLILSLPDLRFIILALLTIGTVGTFFGVVSQTVTHFPYSRITKEEFTTYLFIDFFLSYFMWKSFGVFANNGYGGLLFLIFTLALVLPYITEFLLQGVHMANRCIIYCKNIPTSKAITSLGIIIIVVSVILGASYASLLKITREKYQEAQEQSRIARYPVIYEVQPRIAYHATKVIINGGSFDWNTSTTGKLMSTYGQILPELWTDTKIVFSIPLHWRVGKVAVWVEKPIEWQARKSNAKSNVVYITILSTLGPWSPEDDEYFRQLPLLDFETRHLNGYE